MLSPAPIEVTDEEYELICKYNPEQQLPSGPSDIEKLQESVDSIKNWITFIGIIVLLGVIISFILGVITVSSYNTL